MPKTKIVRVINGRFHFCCAECKAKRMIAVPAGVRKRSFRCHKCKEVTRCVLNRRVYNREQQLGKVLMKNSDGSEIEVYLADISRYGIGFDAKFNDLRRIAVGKSITFTCPWNPSLLDSGRFIVKSIKGQRVGAEIERRRF